MTEQQEYPIQVSRRRSFHASIVLNDKAVSELSEMLTSVGWYIDRITIKARDGREGRYKTLADLESVTAALWRHAEKLTFWAKSANEEHSQSFVCLNLERACFASMGRPASIYVSGPEQEVMLVESQLEQLVSGLAQWYSPLSRLLWWQILLWLVTLAPLINIGLFKWIKVTLFRTSLAYLWWWVPAWLALMFMTNFAGRYRFFPTCVFDIGHARGTADVFAARRKRVLQALAAIAMALVSALTAKLLR